MQDTKQEQGATKQSLTTIETRVHRAIMDFDAIGIDATAEGIAESLSMPVLVVDETMVTLVLKDVIEVCYGEVWYCDDLGYEPAKSKE